jgi:hypothetical protein
VSKARKLRLFESHGRVYYGEPRSPLGRISWAPCRSWRVLRARGSVTLARFRTSQTVARLSTTRPVRARRRPAARRALRTYSPAADRAVRGNLRLPDRSTAVCPGCPESSFTAWASNREPLPS